jgi:hypothetical protein
VDALQRLDHALAEAASEEGVEVIGDLSGADFFDRHYIAVMLDMLRQETLVSTIT